MTITHHQVLKEEEMLSHMILMRLCPISNRHPFWVKRKEACKRAPIDFLSLELKLQRDTMEGTRLLTQSLPRNEMEEKLQNLSALQPKVRGDTKHS